MSYKDEQLSKYVNSVYHLNEKNAVARQIDAMRAAGQSEEEIRKNPIFAQELDRQNSNTNLADIARQSRLANNAYNTAQKELDNVPRATPTSTVDEINQYDRDYNFAQQNLMDAGVARDEAHSNLEKAKADAKSNTEARHQQIADAAKTEEDRLAAEKNDKLVQTKLANYEKVKAELEQAKKELEELKAKAAQGDENAAKEAEKVEDIVDQKTEEVQEEQAEVENAKDEATTASTSEETANAEAITPPTAEELNTGAETTTTQTSPEETANAQAEAEAAATQSAMEIKPTDTPEIQQAKQNFQQEWADLKTQIGSIQDTTKKLMASPIATFYVKQRPDLATKFQKFGGALAAMGSIVGLAGMITMFINPALGGILSAAGRTMIGAGGATASGANAVKQFKNGNVLGGIGSLAAAGMSGAMAGMGAKSLAGNIGTMQAANAAPTVSTGTTDANSVNGNTTQSFTPGSNPAQFTNREPTIANTNDAVANARPGDVLQRNDGTRIEINQGDINWAKAHQAQPVVPQTTPQVGAQTVNTGIPLLNQNAGTPNFGNITLPQGVVQPKFLNDYNAYKSQTQPNPLFNSSANPLSPNLGNIKAPQGILQPNLNDYNAYKTQPSMNLSQGVNIGGNNPPNWVPNSWSQPHQLAPNVSFPYVNTVGNNR